MRPLLPLLLLAAACGRPPDPIVTALPPMPVSPSPSPEDSGPLLQEGMLPRAGFPEGSGLQLRSSDRRSTTWTITAPSGPPGQVRIDVHATPEEAARALAAEAAAQGTPSGRPLTLEPGKHHARAREEDFVPEGTFIRTVDVAVAKGPRVIVIRLEETSREPDGSRVALRLERRALALAGQIAP